MAKQRVNINELKAAGKKPDKLPQVPKLGAGEGNPPLPVGKPIGRVVQLTEAEREALEAIGWDESMPVPKNIRKAIEQVSEAAKKDAARPILPVDPRTKKTEWPEPVALESLPEEQQERIRGAFQNFIAQEEEDQKQEAQAEVQREARERKAEENRQKELNKLFGANESILEIDFDDEDSGETEQEETEDAPPSETPKAKENDTGAGGTVINICPHCNHDVTKPATKEPTRVQKLSYLHSLLGQIPYEDSISLYDGSITVVFRSLMTRELGVIYAQAYRDLKTEKIKTELDFYETLNRYRLFLQLKAIYTSNVTKGFSYDLPEGYDKATNPRANGFWCGEGGKLPAREIKPSDAIKTDADITTGQDTYLPDIDEYITTNILNTEALFRIVNAASNNFNRAVAWMEQRYDSTDFIEPTESQS